MLKDRVAVITGSTSGIGRITALEMARQGASIVITSNEPDKFDETLAEVREFAPRAEAIETDVSDKASMEALVKFTQEQFGRLDILVNNAGITRDGLLMRMKDQDWESVLAINLTSIFHLTRLAIRPMMKARFGRIVNIASVVGFTGNPGQANYTAAKAGLVGFSRSVAREVANRGITVNCVAPGFIRTAMTDKLNDKAREAILSQIPMAEMGTAQDVAEAIIFLSSDQSRYITGETIHVNGGMYMG